MRGNEEMERGTRSVSGPGDQLRYMNFSYCALCGAKHTQVSLRLCPGCAKLPVQEIRKASVYCSWCGGYIRQIAPVGTDQRFVCQCGTPM